MYIDTHDKSSLISSVANILHMAEQELIDELKNYCNDMDDVIDDNIDTLIEDKFDDSISEVLFFHLSRRIEIDDNTGYNLWTMLTTKNSFSDFLGENGLKFKERNNKIEIYLNDSLVKLDDKYSSSYPQLVKKLGYLNVEPDKCLNGFALCDLLYKHRYVNDLYGGPEILNNLDNHFGFNGGLVLKFCNQSEYYCYEYKIPIEDIILDAYSSCNDSQGKQKYLLKFALKRIVDYLRYNIQDMNDANNLILRLPDEYILDSKYLVSKRMVSELFNRN